MRNLLLMPVILIILLACNSAVAHYCDCFPGGPASGWQNSYISISNTAPTFNSGTSNYFQFNMQLHTTSDKGGGCISYLGETPNPTDCTNTSGCYLKDSTCGQNPPIFNFKGSFSSCQKKVGGAGSYADCSGDLSYSGQYSSTPESIILPGTPNDLWMNNVKVDVSNDADYGIYQLNFRVTWDPDIYAPTTSGSCSASSGYSFSDQTGYLPSVSGRYSCGSFIKEVRKDYVVTLCLYECQSNSQCSSGTCQFFSSPCNAGGICSDTCIPSCTGKECGDNGCQGSCGSCGSHESCSSSLCACNSGYGDCNAQSSDGCEANLNTDESHCGSCSGTCTSSQTCVSGTCQASCTPSCSGKSCGDDGCGGSCGSCSNSQTCVSGSCQATCTPSCSGKSCGDNGCGGTCGTCTSSQTCVSGTCQAICTPVWSCTTTSCQEVNGAGVMTETCIDTACSSATQTTTKQCRLATDTKPATATRNTSTRSPTTPAAVPNRSQTTAGSGNTGRTKTSNESPANKDPKKTEDSAKSGSGSSNMLFYIVIIVIVLFGAGVYAYLKNKNTGRPPSSGDVNLSNNMQSLNKLQQQNRDDLIRP
jgi:hypothetical protein